MKTIHDEHNNYPTYKDMSKNRRLRKHQVNFISVPYNVGCTTYFNPRDATRNENQRSFGVARYFFRFNFTTAIQDTAMAYVDWSMFNIKEVHRTCCFGRLARTEWSEGPKKHNNICPFIDATDIIPSRFVMAYDENLEVAFIGLDPERVGETNDDGFSTDLGDNITRHKQPRVFDNGDDDQHANNLNANNDRLSIIPELMERFLNM